LSQLFRSPYIVAPLLAWAVAQVSKVIVDSVWKHHFSIRRLATAGGMPSSHTAMVVALTTELGKRLGLADPLFAAAVVFSSVVMYDATGVRRAAGRQAVLLNRMMDDFFARRGFKEQRLREFVGHTPIEVVAGAILGLIFGLSV
jgi:acid phosphatase family membrane protein YuiD